MKTLVRIFHQTTIILLWHGMSVYAQPIPITEVPAASKNFNDIGAFVYSTSHDSLFRTDGSAAGTVFLKNGFDSPASFYEFKGMLFLTEQTEPGTFNGHRKELWRSDGTPSGTILLKTSSEYGLRILTQTTTHLYFTASDPSSGFELYKTDGTVAGTQLIKDISPGLSSGYIGGATAVNNIIFFGGNDGINGTELWRTDGTAGGTVMIKDINPGSGDGLPGAWTGFVFSHAGRYYFNGQAPDLGLNPWISDGTAAGTVLLADVATETENTRPAHFAIAHEGFVYFMVDRIDDRGEERADLWKTGGTPATTSMIKTVEEGYNSFLVYHDKIYFFTWPAGVYSILWVTDGTTAGTQSLFSIPTHEGGIWFFEVVNDRLLFFGNHQGYHSDFYRSDGTSAGTEKFTPFNSTGLNSGPRDVARVGDLVFYSDHDGPGYEGVPDNPDDYYHLIQGDGYTAQSMRTMFGVPTLGTDNIVNFDGQVLFTTQNDHFFSDDPTKTLWVYDPTTSPGPLTGTIQSETWTGIFGREISAIPLETAPSSVTDLTRFETPENIGDNYGTRVRGYVMAPQTGSYRFWMTSDDKGELWLSTDDTPDNKVRIAAVTGWTNPREWEKYPAQRSGLINLVAGEKYYIEALFKEGTGRDHLAIGWQLPDDQLERPIPGHRLMPFEEAGPGIIRQEFWINVPGTRVSAIPLNTQPDLVIDRRLFEGPASSFGDNYGSRLRGYIRPPTSGKYTFWIAGDDQVELWLSTDDNPANKTRIAYHTGWTRRHEWTRYPTQQSVAITLVGHQRYYIEALMKEAGGADHVSVGWQFPDGSLQRPIAGRYLLPFNPEPVCTASGTIVQEVWVGVDGTRVASIPLASSPDAFHELTIFETGINVANNFGSRVRGYVCVPASGDYTFWISSDDHSELWLSTDDDPANKTRIAHVWGWTTPRQWDRYTTQQSAPISLVSGKRYYIEALYKEDEGGDHLSVGWQLPSGQMERPIPGRYLSSFENEMFATQTQQSEADRYAEISVYPNPARSGDVLTISGYQHIAEPVQTHIQIINMTGEIVFDDNIRCGGDCEAYLMNVNERLVPGLYFIKLKTNGVQSSRRYLVK